MTATLTAGPSDASVDQVQGCMSSNTSATSILYGYGGLDKMLLHVSALSTVSSTRIVATWRVKVTRMESSASSGIRSNLASVRCGNLAFSQAC